jgi:hypothetical protein
VPIDQAPRLGFGAVKRSGLPCDMFVYCSRVVVSLVKNGHQFVCLSTGCYRGSVFSFSIFDVRDSFGPFGSDDNEFLESWCWECRAGDVKGGGRDASRRRVRCSAVPAGCAAKRVDANSSKSEVQLPAPTTKGVNEVKTFTKKSRWPVWESPHIHFIPQHGSFIMRRWNWKNGQASQQMDPTKLSQQPSEEKVFFRAVHPNNNNKTFTLPGTQKERTCTLHEFMY